MMRTLAPLLLLLAAACSTVKQVDVSTTLAAPESPVQQQAAGVRVAVLLPPLQLGAPVRSASGQDQVTPQARAPISVPFTGSYSEEYPSRRHMEATIPAALREAGFQVVEARSLEEAQASGAAHILELVDPQLEGFKRAEGRGRLLEGTVYDIHVHYGARLLNTRGVQLAEVNGHGESSTNFLFSDAYLEMAVVGAASIGLMALVSAVVAIPAAAFLIVRARQDATDPLDQCTDTTFQGVDPPPGRTSKGICGQAAWLAAEMVFLVAVTLSAGATLLFTQTVGGWVFGGVTGAIKGMLGEGTWASMLKQAHDDAARDFAVAAGRALVPERSRTGRRP